MSVPPGAVPVLLVHGFGTSADRTWRDNGWTDLLADLGRPVVAPDLLGHGSAPTPHDPAAYDRLEERVLDDLPPEPVDAVGFSLGARVVLVLAGTHPERFRRLVLAGVGANLFRGDDPSLVADAVAGSAPPEDPLARYFQQLAAAPGADRAALAACLRRPSPPVIDDALMARVVQPTLVVLGDEDFAGPADPLLERLPDARFQPLRRTDHMATPKSMAFLDAALSFLDA